MCVPERKESKKGGSEGAEKEDHVILRTYI